MDVSRRELLCLALDAQPGSLDRPPLPWRHTLEGLTEAVTSDGMPKELDVLLELEELEADGLVMQGTSPVEELDEQRQGFELTDQGRKQALKLRRELEPQPIEVRHDGELVEVSLQDVGEYLETDVPIVRALVDADEEGIVDADRYRPGERFVGRDRIISLFEKDVWNNDEDPIGLLLRGPSGVGKAAITEEVGRSIRGNDNTVLVGDVPRSGSASYGPFRTIFTNLDDEPTPFETVTPPNERMDAEDYQSMRLSLFYDLYKRLQEYALEEGPTLVVLRNLQWASPATMDLFTFLLTRFDEAPVSFLCTVNTEHQADDAAVLDRLGNDQRPVTADLFMPIEVKPLDRWEFEPLVKWHFRVESVPEEFLDVLHEHTGGNPEYVASILEQLQAEDRLDLEHGVYPTSRDELVVPEATRSLIASRVDRLDEVHREVLEAAAIVGETASLAVLTGMVDPSESELRPIARELVSNALWEEHDVPTAILSRSYRFRTPLAREVILDTIGTADRLGLHETAAEAVLDTTLAPDRFKEAVAAEHYDEAAMPEQALENYRKAGERANRLYDHDDAVDFYERALDLADALDLEEAGLDILEALSRVQYCKGDAGAAADTLQRLLDRTEDPERIQSVELARWRMAKDQGNFDEADEYARSGIEVLDEPSPLTCRFWGKLGWTQLQRGNVEDAEEYFDHQEALVEEVDDEVSKGDLYYNRALLARARGNLEEATDLSEQAVLYHKRGKSERDLILSQMLQGITQIEINNHSKADRAFEAARDNVDEIGDRVLEVYLDSNYATSLLDCGKWSAALEEYEEIIETAATLDQQRVMMRLLTNTNSIYCYRGELEIARERAEEALEIAESVGEVSAIAMAKDSVSLVKLFENDIESARLDATTAFNRSKGVLTSQAAETACRLGYIELAAGNPQCALEKYHQAQKMAAKCDSSTLQSYAVAGCAAAQLEQGDPETALDTARTARAEAEHCSDVEVLVHVQLWLAQCLSATGALQEALNEIESALDTAREVDATLLEGRCLLEQGRIERNRNSHQAVDYVATALVLSQSAGAELLIEWSQKELNRIGTEADIDISDIQN
jgi:tetratricopeptide (TPR) repeat protein